MKKMYGYWIAKDEIINVEHEACHANIAYEILSDRFNVPVKRLCDSVFSIYQFMFRLGYVRVINLWSGGCGVEYRHDLKLSRLQKDFVESAEYCELVARSGRTIQ